MIVGLVVSQGKVLLAGEDITSVPMYKRARQGISYLPQEPSIFRKLTVLENILAIAKTLPYPSKKTQGIRTLLKELELIPLTKQKAYTLSERERRRLEITRALVVQPRFLLMGEPFSGIDPISVQEVQKIIQSLKEKNIGVLITDHNVRKTLRIVDRAYLIHEGKVMRGKSSYTAPANF